MIFLDCEISKSFLSNIIHSWLWSYKDMLSILTIMLYAIQLLYLKMDDLPVTNGFQLMDGFLYFLFLLSYRFQSNI